MITFDWSTSSAVVDLPIAIATRPQFGSAPCTAVLTSGELTMALATRLACSADWARSTLTSISFSAPSPSRATCLVSDDGDLVQAVLERVEIDGAGSATGHDDRRVAGRGVGVDRHAVERAVDDPPEDRVEVVGGDARVGEQQGDQRGHVRLDHPDTLGDADDACAADRSSTRPSERCRWS